MGITPRAIAAFAIGAAGALILAFCSRFFPKPFAGIAGVLSVLGSAALLFFTLKRARRGVMHWDGKDILRSERPAAFWGLVLHHLAYVAMLGLMGTLSFAFSIGRFP